MFQWIVPGLRGMFIDPSVLSILVRKTFMCKQVCSATIAMHYHLIL